MCAVRMCAVRTYIDPNLTASVILQRFAKLTTENVDLIGWLTQKTHFFGIELSNLGAQLILITPVASFMAGLARKLGITQATAAMR